MRQRSETNAIGSPRPLNFPTHPHAPTPTAREAGRGRASPSLVLATGPRPGVISTDRVDPALPIMSRTASALALEATAGTEGQLEAAPSLYDRLGCGDSDILSLILDACDLRSLRRLKAVDSRLCALGRRTLCGESWRRHDRRAREAEMRLAFWEGGRYCSSRLRATAPRGAGPFAARGSTHADKVSGVVFSGDSVLASASWDGTICLWRYDDADANLDPEQLRVTAHPAPVLAVAMRGGVLATSCSDAVLRVWSGVDCAQRTMPLDSDGGGGFAGAIAWADEMGEVLVSGSSETDFALRVWRPRLGVTATARAPAHGAHRRPIASLVAHGAHAASASLDCTVKWWALDSLACTETREAHDASVLSLALCERGTGASRAPWGLVASGDRNGTIHMWDSRVRGSLGCLSLLLPTPGEPPQLGTRLLGREVACRALALQGHCLAAGGAADRAVHIWDLRMAFRGAVSDWASPRGRRDAPPPLVSIRGACAPVTALAVRDRRLVSGDATGFVVTHEQPLAW